MNFWFDLDNSPHVPLFQPIFKKLNNREVKTFVTAREFAQTKDLLELYNIDHHLVGKHGGKNKLSKLINLFVRAGQLNKTIKGTDIQLAVSHGSRTQLITCRKKNIPSVLMLDYEFTESKIFNKLADHIIIPKFIPDDRLIDQGFNIKKVIRYNCFKEELYLSEFKEDPKTRTKLGINSNELLVVIRPPSMVGNYHDKRSENLLIATINQLSQFDNAVVLIVNRTNTEKQFIKTNIQIGGNIRFLEKAVDGLQLLHAADITISGGGTMNRESALLGTKTYSIFSGRKPFLDEYLEEQGRLKFISSTEEIESIIPEKNYEKNVLLHSSNPVNEITDILIDLAKRKQRK